MFSFQLTVKTTSTLANGMLALRTNRHKIARWVTYSHLTTVETGKMAFADGGRGRRKWQL